MQKTGESRKTLSKFEDSDKKENIATILKLLLI